MSLLTCTSEGVILVKIEELRAQLKSIRGNKEVFMSSDAEGNSYHPVDVVLEQDKLCIIYPKHEDVNL